MNRSPLAAVTVLPLFVAQADAAESWTRIRSLGAGCIPRSGLIRSAIRNSSAPL
jgi:hypothetical protein